MPRGGAGYVVDVQSRLLEDLATRVVIPLLLKAVAPRIPLGTLNPVLVVVGGAFVVMTPNMASLPVAWMGNAVGSPGAERDRIVRAIDALLSGIRGLWSHPGRPRQAYRLAVTKAACRGARSCRPSERLTHRDGLAASWYAPERAIGGGTPSREPGRSAAGCVSHSIAVPRPMARSSRAMTGLPAGGAARLIPGVAIPRRPGCSDPRPCRARSPGRDRR